MSDIKQVAVSGTVGKQVFPTSSAVKDYSGNVVGPAMVRLEAIYLTPSAANATITIRSGNASGDVKLFARATSATGTLVIHGMEDAVFNRGMHVKVIGTLAQAYLVYE